MWQEIRSCHIFTWINTFFMIFERPKGFRLINLLQPCSDRAIDTVISIALSPDFRWRMNLSPFSTLSAINLIALSYCKKAWNGIWSKVKVTDGLAARCHLFTFDLKASLLPWSSYAPHAKLCSTVLANTVFENCLKLLCSHTRYAQKLVTALIRRRFEVAWSRP